MNLPTEAYEIDAKVEEKRSTDDCGSKIFESREGSLIGREDLPAIGIGTDSSKKRSRCQRRGCSDDQALS